MELAIASDHAGYELKEELVSFLKERGLAVRDMGPASADAVDYPDFGKKVAAAVAAGQVDRGILVCGSGIGMSIVANRFRGVRAALCCNAEMARLSREHNDANVLVLGARFTDTAAAREIARVWLETPFSALERHERRIGKMERD